MAIWRITTVSLVNHQYTASNSLHHPSKQLWMRTKRQERLTDVALINIHYHTIISTDDIITIIQICKESPQTPIIQIIHWASWLETPMLVWVLTFVYVVCNGRRKYKCTLCTCMLMWVLTCVYIVVSNDRRKSKCTLLTDKFIQKEG